MQIINADEKIPGLPEWTLEDMTHDNILLQAELKNLNYHQSVALKSLLIAQCVLIAEQMQTERFQVDPEWIARARFAKTCKETSISSIVAHIADLGRARDEDLRSKTGLQMESQKRKIENQRHQIHLKEREFSLFKTILRERLPENFMEEVYEELEKRMEADSQC